MEIYVDNDRRVFVSFGNGPFLMVTENGVGGEWFIPQGVEVYDSDEGARANAWNAGYDEGYDDAVEDATEVLSTLDRDAKRRRRERLTRAAAAKLAAEPMQVAG